MGYRETWLHHGRVDIFLSDVTREMIGELSLPPQVLLEPAADDIFATGMFGPIDGRFHNLPG